MGTRTWRPCSAAGPPSCVINRAARAMARRSGPAGRHRHRSEQAREQRRRNRRNRRGTKPDTGRPGSTGAGSRAPRIGVRGRQRQAAGREEGEQCRRRQQLSPGSRTRRPKPRTGPPPAPPSRRQPENRQRSEPVPHHRSPSVHAAIDAPGSAAVQARPIRSRRTGGERQSGSEAVDREGVAAVATGEIGPRRH